MSLRIAPALALSCIGLVAFAGAAAAEAPIVYAGQGSAPVQTAALEDGRLVGGSDASYGYGAQRPNEQAAVIDLRRPTHRVQPTQQTLQQPVEPAQSDAAAPVEEGAPAWLEQERVGPPYQANGRWYVPTPEPGYEQTGAASWYGAQFHGQRTASGETFDQEALTAAHPTLPIPSLVQVTNLENGREVIVRVNDRGPFVEGRLIDLSLGAARVLGFAEAGHARVHVRYLGPAPRRVNADGSPAPVQAPSPAPSPAPYDPPARQAAADGPVSLLPSAAPELAGAPVAAVVQPTAYAPAGSYFVQVGAFSDPGNADRVGQSARTAGPVVIDVRRTAAGGELFRVRIGPWSSRQEAEAARQHLAQLGYHEAVVAAR